MLKQNTRRGKTHQGGLNMPANNWDSLSEILSMQNFLTSSNPVILSLKSGQMRKNQGLQTLRQYYYLVTSIVQFLTIAMVRIPAPKVKEELRRNLSEELGSRTSGESHQEILETLLRKELGMNVRTSWNKATQTFISDLLLCFNTVSPEFVAGMIYALEATACPELLVVAEIINLSAGREVVCLAKLTDQASALGLRQEGATTLQNFLALHTLDFEQGHESGLRATLEEFVQADWKTFEAGFLFVLTNMKTWWRELARAS